MDILFLNSYVKQCGVYQYGIRVYDILKHSSNINYKYYEVHNVEEYYSILAENPTCRAIIYNYHSTPMNWLTITNIQHRVKNIGVIHESSGELFDIIIDPNPDIVETPTYIGLPRPIYSGFHSAEYTPSTKSIQEFIEEGVHEDIHIIGSFGFGFNNKGFQQIISHVNSNYDNALIKFVIPMAFYSDQYGYNKVIHDCKTQITKPGIRLMITHEFLSNEDVLKFLASNTVNMFLYDYMYGRGISSALDYAMSIDTPFIISDSFMFRHIYTDDICIYKNSISHCIQRSKLYIPQLQKKFSHENMRNVMDSLILRTI
jgi:hypothetical protein